jgi:hypothetical protein
VTGPRGAAARAVHARWRSVALDAVEVARGHQPGRDPRVLVHNIVCDLNDTTDAAATQLLLVRAGLSFDTPVYEQKDKGVDGVCGRLPRGSARSTV